MAKYQSKPIQVEATQWNKPGDHPKVIEVIKHKNGFAISESDKERYRGIGTVKYAIKKRQQRSEYKTSTGMVGVQTVLKNPELILISSGDWIIEGSFDLYVISNSEFRSKFEPVPSKK